MDQCQTHHILGQSQPAHESIQRIQRHRTNRDEHTEQICRRDQLFAHKISAADHIGRHGRGDQCKHHRQQCQYHAVQEILAEVQLLESINIVVELPVLRQEISAQCQFCVGLEGAQQSVDHRIKGKDTHGTYKQPFQDLADQVNHMISFFRGAHIRPF